MKQRSLSYAVGHATHVGLVREKNEDAHAVIELNGGIFAVVADGVGGHPGGDVASALVIDRLSEFARDLDLTAPPADLLGSLRRGLAMSHERLLRRAEVQKEYKRMATTVVCALLLPSCVLHLYCGDSRLYWCRSDDLYHTRDHNMIEMMVDQGLSREEAHAHPQSQLIMSYLGGGKPWPWVTVSPADHERLDPKPGDVLLLCTDGLHGMVANPAIQEILLGESDAQAAAEALVAAALEAGGHDNVSVIVARVEADAGNPTAPG
jgi:protein phosphatase